MRTRALVVGGLLLAAAALWLSWPRASGPVEEADPGPLAASEETAITQRPGRTWPAPALAREDMAEPLAPLRLQPASVRLDATATAGAVSGLVLSRGTGRGVPGAELTFVAAGGSHSAHSDREGRFALAALAPGRHELAAVAAEGFLPYAPPFGQSPIAFMAQPQTRIEGVVVYLTPATWYEGLVLDPAERPVAEAAVRVVAGAGELAAVGEDVEAQATRSDAAGRFRVQAGDWAQVEASHPDWAPGQAWIDQRVQAGGSLTIRLRPADERLTGGQRIGGTVLGPDGEPFEGAQVMASFTPSRATGREPPRLAPAYAGSDHAGRFVLDGLHRGLYYLRASAEGLVAATLHQVPAGTDAAVLRLRSGGRLVGTVTSGGAPVPAFTVVLERDHGGQRRGPPRAVSALDGRGQYEVRGLEAGRYWVRVAAFGHTPAPEHAVNVPPGAGPARADFELGGGSRVHGQVRSEQTQRPLAGAQVSGEGALGGDTPLPVLASTVTGPDGRFELVGLGAGLRSIMVTATGHHGRLVSGLRVEPDGEVGPLTIELAPLAEDEEPRLELTGIGAVLRSADDGLTIISVVAGGGAAEAGLAAGDAILAIDGAAATGMTLQEAIERIRGVEGTSVRLAVRRAASGQTAELDILRRRVRS